MVKFNQSFNCIWIRRQIYCKEKFVMLFYGGIFLHCNKFIQTMPRGDKETIPWPLDIASSALTNWATVEQSTKFLGHVHMPIWLVSTKSLDAICSFFWSFLAKINSLTSFRTWPHLNSFTFEKYTFWKSKFFKAVLRIFLYVCKSVCCAKTLDGGCLKLICQLKFFS